ncbi:hypothetical protein LTR64_002881 [Lithohypha guttulata]|uniref:uncharacterized protein n=1 Tax=Lithohypha guttulata TaxID=1690604 RepID=UPI002DDE8C51|nr:hypothetical protein LTR51_000895 [Lithohypha guttulata]
MAGTGVKVTLFIFSALGFWTLWGFPARNNLLHFLGELSEPGASIPGPAYYPMKQRWTGIEPVDKQLTTLVGFFYTAIDGNRIDITLSFLNLGSQVLAAWILITTESYRSGNKGSLTITSITIFGLLVAIVGYACVAPIYFVLHLINSPVVKNPRDWNVVLDQPIKLAIVPVATLIGFGIPSALMALPAPGLLTLESKLNWTAIQQGWPIWIYFSQKALEALVAWFDPMVSMRTEKQKRAETAKYMYRAYVFALGASAGAHLLFVGMGLAAWLLPGALSAKLQVQLHPENFFIPPNPFSDEKATTLANGALWFLQWDLIVGVLSTMVWGITVRLSAVGKVDSFGAWVAALIKYGFLSAVVGPSGAAVWAIWERDVVALKVKRE